MNGTHNTEVAIDYNIYFKPFNFVQLMMLRSS